MSIAAHYISTSARKKFCMRGHLSYTSTGMSCVLFRWIIFLGHLVFLKHIQMQTIPLPVSCDRCKFAKLLLDFSHLSTKNLINGIAFDSMNARWRMEMSGKARSQHVVWMDFKLCVIANIFFMSVPWNGGKNRFVLSNVCHKLNKIGSHPPPPPTANEGWRFPHVFNVKFDETRLKLIQRLIPGKLKLMRAHRVPLTWLFGNAEHESTNRGNKICRFLECVGSKYLLSTLNPSIRTCQSSENWRLDQDSSRPWLLKSILGNKLTDCMGAMPGVVSLPRMSRRWGRSLRQKSKERLRNRHEN